MLDFSFHILNEIRHLFWDAGFGFDLKISKITGFLALVGSFVLTILFYLIGKNFFKMHVSTKKWLFTKISSLILMPFMIWFLLSFVSIYDKNYSDIIAFFSEQPAKILFSVFIIISFFFSALTISEIFEDYISNDRIKNVANKALYLFAILIPLLTILSIYKL